MATKSTDSNAFELHKSDRMSSLIYSTLLPGLDIKSIAEYEPVEVFFVPEPWKLLGCGNYAAVLTHPDYRDKVVKVYAPGRDGWADEVEVYRRLGIHPAYSRCLYAAHNFIVLKRLYGINLYEALHNGIPIPEQVIVDIDSALDYARSRGLHPHDVHGKNIMLHNGRGFVVDVSDFLDKEDCSKWRDMKKAYYLLYRPFLLPFGLKLPYFILDLIRTIYRLFRRSFS